MVLSIIVAVLSNIDDVLTNVDVVLTSGRPLAPFRTALQILFMALWRFYDERFATGSRISHHNLLAFDLQITLKCLDVGLERLPAFCGDAADGAGTLALEGLFHFDVARRREFFYLHAQVARRSSRLLLDIWELSLVGTDEQRHHGQSQLGVQQWV